MNWLDFVLAIILLACIVGSFRRGFSRQVIGLVAGVLALVLGIWLYGTVGYHLMPYVSSRTALRSASLIHPPVTGSSVGRPGFSPTRPTHAIDPI